jgi:hypothetical protein
VDRAQPQQEALVWAKERSASRGGVYEGGDRSMSGRHGRGPFGRTDALLGALLKVLIEDAVSIQAFGVWDCIF